jgi:hypothetical protein
MVGYVIVQSLSKLQAGWPRNRGSMSGRGIIVLNDSGTHPAYYLLASGGKAARSVELTTQLHQVLMLKISGSPPLYALVAYQCVVSGAAVCK